MKVCALPAGTGGVAFYRMKQPLRDLYNQGHEILETARIIKEPKPLVKSRR